MFTVPKFEIPFRYIIWGLFALMVTGCTSCALTGGKSAEARLIDEIAENCEHGLKSGSVTMDDGETEVRGECAGYGL